MQHRSNNKKYPYLQVPEFCPNCQKKYLGAKINIINNFSNSIIMHMTCPFCNTSVLSNISFNNVQVMAVGMLTDLLKEDLNILHYGDNFNADDILEIYDYLRKNKTIKLTN